MGLDNCVARRFKRNTTFALIIQQKAKAGCRLLENTMCPGRMLHSSLYRLCILERKVAKFVQVVATLEYFEPAALCWRSGCRGIRF